MGGFCFGWTWIMDSTTMIEVVLFVYFYDVVFSHHFGILVCWLKN